MPFVPPLPRPQETLSRELFPAHQGPVLPGVLVAKEQDAEGDEPARLVKELQAAARRSQPR